DVDHDAVDHHRPGRRSVRLAGVAIVALLLAGGAFAAWRWVERQYFVGVWAGQVAVFRGLPQDLGPINLATLDHTTGVLVDTLPPADRDSVKAGFVVDGSSQAAQKVAALRQAACEASPPPTPAPATSGSAVPRSAVPGSAPPSPPVGTARPLGTPGSGLSASPAARTPPALVSAAPSGTPTTVAAPGSAGASGCGGS
ncbi:MAG TPA: hypothetical protein VMT69_02240, partial [Kineosporiaceae bacterium]|nr:hypothetical protein [Kineosporiaceae bacterium]